MNGHDGKPPGATRTAVESQRMLASGTLLAGRYRIEALTGVGGMGMVYRARDEELGVVVALKVMRPERLAEQHMLERFRRELVLARQVTHRNVVRIHDIGSDEGRLFLTMDFIDGRPLNDLLEKEGPLAVNRAVHIAAQLARALAAAHAEEVVHRDLKPANILVADGDRAFITDFGIARSLGTAGLTDAGSILGTPDYLSPEQARGDTVDGRSDIYALGLILYRMLTGELPFSGATFEEIVAQHTAGHARDITRTGVNVPRWLRRTIGRCLQREPADRYQDAGELARDLERHDSRWRMQGRWLRAAAVGVLAFGIGSALVWNGRRVTEPAPAVPDVGITAGYTVAVLPLKREGKMDEWIAGGFSELLSAQLAESAELHVIEPERLQRTLGDLEIHVDRMTDNERRQLVELLGVERLVSGSIIGNGNAFRIQLRVTVSDRPDTAPRMLVGDFAFADGWQHSLDALSRELRDVLEVSKTAVASTALTDSLPALESYARGVKALRDGDSLAALPDLEEAVTIDTAFIAAWVALSDAYSAAGRDDEALDAARNAVGQLGPESGRWSFEARARLAALGGEPEQAEQFLVQLLQAYPHDVETRVELAETIGESGRFDEAIDGLKKVVGQDANHPRAWYLMGKYSILNGDSQRAVDDFLVRALVIHNTLGNDQGRADVFNALGIASHELGQLQQAREYYAQAAQLREGIGDERGVVAALSNIARLQMVEGDYAGAREQFEQALRKLDAIGDRHGVASMHNELGILEEERGDYAAALDRYRTALQARERLGDRRAMAESYNNVGYAYYLLGEYDNAAVYLRQSLDAYIAMKNPDGEMQARQTYGLLEIARGNWNAALKAFLAAMEIARAIDYPHAVAVSRGNLGHIAQLQGRYAAAADAYAEAIGIMENVGDPRGLAEFTLHHAEMALDLGLPANPLLEKARAALNEAGNVEQGAWLAVLDARAALLDSDTEKARERINQAMLLAGQSGGKLTKLRAVAGLVELLLGVQEYDRALSEAGKYRGAADTTGNVSMRLQLLRLEATAASLSGETERARKALREAQRLAHDVGEYADGWRLHALAAVIADIESARMAEQEQAQQAYLRIRQNMNAAQRAAFESRHPLQSGEEGKDEYASVGE